MWVQNRRNSRHGVDQPSLVFHSGYARQFGLERIKALGVHRLFVHAGTVVVANLLLNRTAAGIFHGRLLQYLSQSRFVPFVNFDEAHPLRLVGGNFCRLQPVAAGVLIKVGAGIHHLVDVIDAEAFGGLCRMR